MFNGDKSNAKKIPSAHDYIGKDTAHPKECCQCIYGQIPGECKNPKGLCGVGLGKKSVD